MNVSCLYGEYQKNGMRSWIKCIQIDRMCPFQRYCINEKKVVHTLDANKCKIRMNDGK